jgi:hypothetical protein
MNNKLKTNTGACRFIFGVIIIGLISTTTSCTSMLLQSGTNPWETIGRTPESVHAQFSAPKKQGLMSNDIRRLLDNNNPVQYSSLAKIETYEIIDIRGPFPADTLDALSACLWSGCTLGIAEIFMLPPAIADKIKNRSEIRTFAFLYNNAGKATMIVEITDSIFGQICVMNEDDRPSIQHEGTSQ